ncbi:hypothetical protein [Chitinophaga eiseniae]|uniref:hypothetical protein n=1 Tax=Chitinophaga eiseniae TaxID=634771 RepID=UPI0011775E6A|nr:hypothetical protein [Chitinophaga eiseniae]
MEINFQEQYFDIEAPIIPGVSLGGIQQGMLVKGLEKMFRTDQYFARDKKISLVTTPSLRYIEYWYMGGIIRLKVDIYDGRITNIIATKGYQGTVNGVLRVGMTVREVLQVDAGFTCYSPPGGLMSPNFLGICLYFTPNFDAETDSLSDYMDHKILGIGLINEFNAEGDDVYVMLYGLNHPRFNG